MVVIEPSEADDNPDLTSERQLPSFPGERLSELLWGGRDRLRRRREISAYVAAHADELQPLFPPEFMSRDEKVENVARLAVNMMKHIEAGAIEPTKPEESTYFNYLVTGIDGQPFYLHFVMALPTLLNNADEEQLAEWLPRMLNREIIATYAQTELGHGTNLRRLETTATYDAASEEFVLNSPTITATKWWPGNLGKSSNYAVVLAQLYTDGGRRCHGAHPFWVQIRDLATHQPVPGVTVGDIGPKFGINSNDNGFLRFERVRIPRRHLFMKHAKVTAGGEYLPPIHAKVNYTAMMFVRAVMIQSLALNLAAGCTIAIRYSCVRRQGEMQEGRGEVKVLDYQTQQYRLLPQLARAFAFFFAGAYVRTLYNSTIRGLDAGDVTLLADLHALSSGLKSHVTHHIALGLEQCRMACGGHGYSMASGLPQLYTVAVGGCTYEGENIVMFLQVARYLMKVAEEVCRPHATLESSATNSEPSPLTAYLYKSGPPRRSSIKASPSAHGEEVLEAMEHAARRQVFAAWERLQTEKASGHPAWNAWNECGVELVRAARSHTRVFLCRNFMTTVEALEDARVKAVFKPLLRLYLNYELLECVSGCLESGFMSGEQVSYLRHQLYSTLSELRPMAVPIVDAFDFTDMELNSVLGRRDGNVYANLLEWAKRSPLNKSQVLPFHEKYLGAAMKAKRAQGGGSESSLSKSKL